MSAAFSSSADLAALLISELSNSKNAGFSGELRFRSSSDVDEMASSRTGSGGTTMGSETGTGGAGGRGDTAASVPESVGGGAGRAIGGFLPPHAATATVNASTPTQAHLTISRRIIRNHS